MCFSNIKSLLVSQSTVSNYYFLCLCDISLLLPGNSLFPLKASMKCLF